MLRRSRSVTVRSHSLAALAAGAAVLALAAACGGSSGSPTTSSQGNGPTITIQSFAYGSPLTVAPGTKITVRNDDSVAHTVTEDSGGAFDADVEGGSTGDFTAPSSDGTYKFHCTFHAQMHGSLIVKG